MSGPEEPVEHIYLLGETITEITGNKLPSKKEVLQLMMYENAYRRDTLQSAKKVYEAILPFWERSGIPVIEYYNAVPKMKKFFDYYKALFRSSRNRAENTTELFKGREQAFIDSLDDLYDISHKTKCEGASTVAKAFLIQQQMKGRPGSIPVVVKIPIARFLTHDTLGRSRLHSLLPSISMEPSSSGTTSIGTSSVTQTLSESMSTVTVGVDVETQTPETSSIFSASTSVGSNTVDDDPDFEISNYLMKGMGLGPSSEDKNKVQAPPTLNRKFITQRVVGVLDRYKISDYAAVHLFAAILIGLGLDASQFVFSKSTINSERVKDRRIIGEDIKEKFKFESKNGSTVHFDGKIMENITTKEKHDRLPIKITHEGTDQLLGVPELADGTGFSIADAVFNMLKDWRQEGKVQCCCFDTTSSNTGCWQGAAVRLEQLLGRSLLYLPCRHHIAEVILRAIFELKVEPNTKSPDVSIFKTFQSSWNDLSHERYKSGVRDRYVKSQLANENLEVLKAWIKNQLAKPICRHDYREFLELSYLFLGESLPNAERRSSTFHRPGPIHHARWMAKAIYSMKMFMFREQILLTEEQRIGLADVCVFIIRYYLVFWFRSPRAIEAPLQDLTLLKNIYATRNVDEDTSDEVIRKMINHLWYLSEENVGFSFFDKRVSTPEKRKMVSRLQYNPGPDHEPPKRIVIDMKDFEQFIQKDISDFVTCNTLNFFERFEINTEFLEHDPATWLDREDYREARNRMKLLKVVNDTAERGVKLMADYNKRFSRNEEEKQFILLVVSKYRELYKSFHKKDLVLDE